MLHLYAFASAVAAAFAVFPAEAGKVTPHADYLADAASPFVGNIDDIDAVFAKILLALPPDVVVNTTENYAYFTFHDRGVEFQGNMRIENAPGGASLSFLYNPRPAPWLPDPPTRHKTYTNTADGFSIAQTGSFSFAVGFRGVNRQFAHLDVSRVAPPDGLLRIDEDFMGQVHDDSGMRFFLIHDSAAQTPLFLLDQTGGFPDQLVPATDRDGKTSPIVLVGMRTGFAFVEEPGAKRLRLVGVHRGNVERNNHFDGPFDQLPDSFAGPFTIRDLFETRDPENAARMNDKGVFTDGSGLRAVVDPYLAYENVLEFDGLSACFQNPTDIARYRHCIAEAVGF